MTRKFHATLSVRLTPAEHTGLKAYAAAQGRSMSEIVRNMVHWAVMPNELAEAVIRVGRERRDAALPRGGLFRLGEDRRIKHLDEGSPLEGVETEGSA